MRPAPRSEVPVGERRPLLLSRIDDPRWWGSPLRWAAATGRQQCDDCVLLLHEVKGAAAPPRRAARKRTSGGDRSTVLCHEHAQNWLDAQTRKARP